MKIGTLHNNPTKYSNSHSYAYTYSFLIHLCLIVLIGRAQGDMGEPFQEVNYEGDLMQMSPWLQDEEKHNQMFRKMDEELTESFVFKLNSGEDQYFKWDPPNKSSGKKLILDTTVLYFTDLGEISLPDSEEEGEHVEIFSKASEHSNYYFIDKVFEHKLIQFQFIDTDYRIIRFWNNYPREVIVAVQMEFPGHIVGSSKAVDDDDLSQQGAAMSKILGLMNKMEKDREIRHQIQVSRMQIENEHFLQLLKFTFLELLAVFGTAMLQAHCIRSVLDNRQII